MIKRALQIQAVLAVLLLSATVHAQSEVTEIRKQNDCRLARQVLESGLPVERLTWASRQITVCGVADRVEARRAAIVRVRTSSDTAGVLQALMPAGAIEDGSLFSEVLDLAADPNASSIARIVAFMVLASIADRTSVPRFRGFASGLDERGSPRIECSGMTPHPRGANPGLTPYPPDFREQIRSLAQRIRASGIEPPEVRSAAACVNRWAGT